MAALHGAQGGRMISKKQQNVCNVAHSQPNGESIIWPYDKLIGPCCRSIISGRYPS